jgi:hypothetical protein
MSPQLLAAREADKYVIEISKEFGLNGPNYKASVIARTSEESEVIGETSHRFVTVEGLAEWVLVAVDAWL